MTRQSRALAAAVVGSLPPVALVLSLETLMSLVQRARQVGLLGHLRATADQCYTRSGSADEAVVTAFLHGRDCMTSRHHSATLASQFGVPRSRWLHRSAA
jgi:hypothetical protein